MSTGDINNLLDDLLGNPELQREFELNPRAVAARYDLTESQVTSLVEGDVDALIREGLAERHVQEMRVSW